MQFDPNDPKFDGGSGFKMIPEGQHLCWISEAEVSSTSTGGLKVTLEFSLHDPESPNCGGVLKFQHYSLSPKALWKLADLCRALGINEAFNPCDQGDVDRLLWGQPLVVEVEHESDNYGGKARTQARAARHRLMNAQEKARLRAEYGEALVPEDPAATSAEGATGYGEDDIPF